MHVTMLSFSLSHKRRKRDLNGFSSEIYAFSKVKEFLSSPPSLLTRGGVTNTLLSLGYRSGNKFSPCLGDKQDIEACVFCKEGVQTCQNILSKD